MCSDGERERGRKEGDGHGKLRRWKGDSFVADGTSSEGSAVGSQGDEIECSMSGDSDMGWKGSATARAEALPARAEDEIMRIRYSGLKDKVRKLELLERHKASRRRRRQAEGKVKCREEVWFTTLAQLEVRKGSESRVCAEWKETPEEDTLFLDVLNGLDEDE